MYVPKAYVSASTRLFDFWTIKIKTRFDTFTSKPDFLFTKISYVNLNRVEIR